MPLGFVGVGVEPAPVVPPGFVGAGVVPLPVPVVPPGLVGAGDVPPGPVGVGDVPPGLVWIGVLPETGAVGRVGGNLVGVGIGAVGATAAEEPDDVLVDVVAFDGDGWGIVVIGTPLPPRMPEIASPLAGITPPASGGGTLGSLGPAAVD